jgi:hypothetical protein
MNLPGDQVPLIQMMAATRNWQPGCAMKPLTEAEAEQGQRDQCQPGGGQR